MLTELAEDVRVAVKAGSHGWEVVDHDWNGTGVGQFLKESDDGGIGHGKMEIAWHENKSKLCTRLFGQTGFCNDFTCALPAAAHGDCHNRTAESLGHLDGRADELLLLSSSQRNGLAVCAGKDDCRAVSSTSVWEHHHLTEFFTYCHGRRSR